MSLFDFSFLAVNLVFEKDPCGSVRRFKGSSDLGEGLTEISRGSLGWGLKWFSFNSKVGQVCLHPLCFLLATLLPQSTISFLYIPALYMARYALGPVSYHISPGGPIRYIHYVLVSVGGLTENA